MWWGSRVRGRKMKMRMIWVVVGEAVAEQVAKRWFWRPAGRERTQLAEKGWLAGHACQHRRPTGGFRREVGGGGEVLFRACTETIQCPLLWTVNTIAADSRDIHSLFSQSIMHQYSSRYCQNHQGNMWPIPSQHYPSGLLNAEGAADHSWGSIGRRKNCFWDIICQASVLDTIRITWGQVRLEN